MGGPQHVCVFEKWRDFVINGSKSICAEEFRHSCKRHTIFADYSSICFLVGEDRDEYLIPGKCLLEMSVCKKDHFLILYHSEMQEKYCGSLLLFSLPSVGDCSLTLSLCVLCVRGQRETDVLMQRSHSLRCAYVK